MLASPRLVLNSSPLQVLVTFTSRTTNGGIDLRLSRLLTLLSSSVPLSVSFVPFPCSLCNTQKHQSFPPPQLQNGGLLALEGSSTSDSQIPPVDLANSPIFRAPPPPRPPSKRPSLLSLPKSPTRKPASTRSAPAPAAPRSSGRSTSRSHISSTPSSSFLSSAIRTSAPTNGRA